MRFKLLDKVQESIGILTFVWESAEPLDWQAGQYIKYTLPHNNVDERGITRFFTIAAPPYETRPRITTRFATEKGSSFKAELLKLNPGDTIEASSPMGDFIVGDTTRPLVFIAGGIGITPFRAILLQLDHDNVQIDCKLLYANRTEDYPFKKEFEVIAKKHSGFKVNYVTDPKHIEAADLKQIKNANENLYYLSGPEPMVESYKDLLLSLGIAEEDIKTDYFPGYSS